MSILEMTSLEGSLPVFSEGQAKAAGAALAETYRNAGPFPHIVLDDFVDAELLRRVLAEFPKADSGQTFQRSQEMLKTQFHPKDCSLFIRHFLAELNSQAFLRFLQEMTGIKGLVPDPYFNGGGLHETRAGGLLGVHADFNKHPKMKLQRRINLLIYLNEDWDDSFGGQLELWDTAMTSCQTRVKPVMARAVMFNTDLDSFHGHPDPLSCPPDRARRSIATYYYTAFPGSSDLAPHRTTVFKARPGSEDKSDWRMGLQHFYRDWMPPIIQRHRSKKYEPAD